MAKNYVQNKETNKASDSMRSASHASDVFEAKDAASKSKALNKASNKASNCKDEVKNCKND